MREMWAIASLKNTNLKNRQSVTVLWECEGGNRNDMQEGKRNYTTHNNKKNLYVSAFVCIVVIMGQNDMEGDRED
jgi:hypothetical protein